MWKHIYFEKFIEYAIPWDKTQMVKGKYWHNRLKKLFDRSVDHKPCNLPWLVNFKKISAGKINITKNALFFLSRAPADHSFTFDSQFLYELKAHGSSVCGIFHFCFRLVFIKPYIFV